MAKRWKCTICGQIFEGDQPPVPCPVCGADRDAFIALDAPARVSWRCTVCGQVFEGDEPPVPCPVCGADRDAFVAESGDAGGEYRRDQLERYVIIGGGVAGLEAAKAIRQRNQLGEITMVLGEGVIPYNRPALSDVIADGYSFESIALEPYEFYEQNRIRLVSGARATGLDLPSRKAYLSDGQTLAYDKLLICTGANPFNPIASGDGLIEVYTLRTYLDAMRIVEKLRGRRVIVVGGGILGLEAAVALRELDARVTVVELGERILPLQADARGAAMLRPALEKQGIEIITGASVASLLSDGAVLTDGRELRADAVLCSIGVRSETALAREAGLKVERGVVVDESMRASYKDVFAAGDCAQFAGRTGGLWLICSEQGRVAGAAMAGDPEAVYHPGVPSTAFENRGVRLFSAGALGAEDSQRLIYEDARGKVYRCMYFKNGALTGVIFINDTRFSAQAIGLIARGASVAECAGLVAGK